MLQSELKIMKQIYRKKMHTNVLSLTEDNREITEVILGRKDASCHILIHGAIHGREHMNTFLIMNQMKDYLEYYNEYSYEGYPWSLLYEDVCFHIIPMANPDGVTISQQGMKGIRNTQLKGMLSKCYENDRLTGQADDDQAVYFKEWKSNARGVDPNRNFDVGWKEYEGAGQPSSEGYKGAQPGSERETQAILSIARRCPLACCIAYHSYGDFVYWDYGSSGELLEADRRLAKCVSKVTQYELRSTIQDGAACAGCSDYFVLKLGIPAVTIETGNTKCPLPVQEYRPIYERNRNLWPALACLYNKSRIF